MRQIKFRAWDKKKNKMFICTNEDISGALCFPDIFDVMQFTGLLDKNRKEIYEGDILMWGFAEPETCVVVDDYADFKLESSDKELHYMPDHRSLEVIGNIYENHHLLK